MRGEQIVLRLRLRFRRFLAVNTKWVLAASVANHVPESLLALAKGAVEGKSENIYGDFI